MEYKVERAIHAREGVFNIDDVIVIHPIDGNPVTTRLVDILWRDEYNAYLVTTEGKFLLEEVKRLEKVKL